MGGGAGRGATATLRASGGGAPSSRPPSTHARPGTRGERRDNVLGPARAVSAAADRLGLAVSAGLIQPGRTRERSATRGTRASGGVICEGGDLRGRGD